MADQFIWYELMTSDQDGAAAFYTAVVGWTAADQTMAELDFRYTILSVGERGVAGLMALTDEMKAGGAVPAGSARSASPMSTPRRRRSRRTAARSSWGRHDIPNVGRFAMVADPRRRGLRDHDAAAARGRSPRRSRARLRAMSAGTSSTPPMARRRPSLSIPAHSWLDRDGQPGHGPDGQIPVLRRRRRPGRRDDEQAGRDAGRRLGLSISRVDGLDAAVGADQGRRRQGADGPARGPRRRAGSSRPPTRRAPISRSSPSAKQSEERDDDRQTSSSPACGSTMARPARRRNSTPRPSPTAMSARRTTRRATFPAASEGDELTVEFTVLGHSLRRPERRAQFQAQRGGQLHGPSPRTRKRPTATGTRSWTMAARRAPAAGARIAGASPGRSRRASCSRRRPTRTRRAAKRAMEAMMTMKKIDIADDRARRRRPGERHRPERRNGAAAGLCRPPPRASRPRGRQGEVCARAPVLEPLCSMLIRSSRNPRIGSVLRFLRYVVKIGLSTTRIAARAGP